MGFSCEVKYQLSRRLFLDKFPDGDLFDFRRLLLTPSYGQRSFERRLFDWQITPFAGVIDYVEHDFQDVFEREDLFVELGEVAHRRHGMRYPHDFHGEGQGIDEAVIDRQYPAARQKFEHLARKFRLMLEQPGPFLYVARVTPTREDAVRLRRRLQGAHPQHRFELLFLGWEEDAQPPDLDGVAHWSWLTLDSDKGSGREWEGNDAAWDEALRPWPLMAHGGDRIRPRFEDDHETA